MLIHSCAPGSYRTRLSIERALQRVRSSSTTLLRRRRQVEPYFQALGWMPAERLIQSTTRKVPA